MELTRALVQPFQRVRLISAEFPWSIILEIGQAPLTVGHVWQALFEVRPPSFTA